MKIDWTSFSNPSIQRGVALMRQINSYGYEAYIVGGCVRDIVLGDKNVHDVDIATNMPIPELHSHFNTHDNGGEKHGTILVEWGGEQFEVTQFRAEQGYSDSRHPDQVSWVNSFEEDTKRRDFTFNAMGIDANGNVIDHHGGVDDLRRKVLRTVGSASERFDEDALRIIRAMRFAARFDMDVDPDTMNGIVSCRSKLSNVAMERVYGELVKTAEYGAKPFASVVDLLASSGCGEVIDPNGYINWDDAATLAESRATHEIFPELGKDVVTSLALLFYGSSNLKKATQFFRCSTDQVKTFDYIYKGLPVYRRLGDSNVVDCVNIARSKDFKRLRQVYVAIHEKDTDDADTIVPVLEMLVSKAVPRLGELTSAMIECGYQTGPDFGKVLRIVSEWFYESYIHHEDPSHDDIVAYIKSIGEAK